MIKRRRQPKPTDELSTHLMKERTGKVVVTKCGVIADVSARQPVKTTAWASEVTCARCRPVPV